jgi:hypothetical protein
MKLFTGWVISAGLVLAATAAHAQGASPSGTGGSYTAVSDVAGPSTGPYAAVPPEAPMPGYGYGPILLPPREVYTVVRENGFSPRGVPQQHGLFYTIAVIDRGGDDGRLVIDARNGRIVRFMPAYRTGNNLNGGVPRPPASVPHVASRTVPMPKASPPRIDDTTPLAATKPAPEKLAPEKSAPAPAQQSAAVQMKPADAQPAPQAAAPEAVEVKPAAPQIMPTQEMPKVQGLE